MGGGTLAAVSTFDLMAEIADRLEADLDSVIAELDAATSRSSPPPGLTPRSWPR